MGPTIGIDQLMEKGESTTRRAVGGICIHTPGISRTGNAYLSIPQALLIHHGGRDFKILGCNTDQGLNMRPKCCVLRGLSSNGGVARY